MSSTILEICIDSSHGLIDSGVDAVHTSANCLYVQKTKCQLVGITTHYIIDTAKVATMCSAMVFKAACA